MTARILLLSEAPGARAVGPGGPRPAARGSGFISFDNNDETAANVYRLFHEADLPRSWLLAWNIVPWYIGDRQHVRAANSEDVDEALPALRAVLQLLTQVRVVVTLGRNAQLGWAKYLLREASLVPVLPAPHPSPRSINRYPQVRGRILRRFRQARSLADPPAIAEQEPEPVAPDAPSVVLPLPAHPDV